MLLSKQNAWKWNKTSKGTVDHAIIVNRSIWSSRAERENITVFLEPYSAPSHILCWDVAFLYIGRHNNCHIVGNWRYNRHPLGAIQGQMRTKIEQWIRGCSALPSPEIPFVLFLSDHWSERLSPIAPILVIESPFSIALLTDTRLVKIFLGWTIEFSLFWIQN